MRWTTYVERGRKVHDCHLCGDPIAVGHPSFRETYRLFDDNMVASLHSWRAHPECHDLAWGEWSEGYDDTDDEFLHDVEGWVRDYLSDWESTNPIIRDAIDRLNPSDQRRERFALWFKDGIEPGGKPRAGAGVQLSFLGTARR